MSENNATNPMMDFGMVGLGVMGRNFLLNLSDHGFGVAGLDLDEQKVAALTSEADKNRHVHGFTKYADFVASLKTPRVIMMLVPAGKPVDAVVESVLPFLSEGDLIIDGGNSFFKDTDTRVTSLEGRKIHFLAVGVSGGELGARFGPSIMPGGNASAYERVKPMFEAVAAKVNGLPCVTYLGERSSGHYVKMVHNGIEYGLMQLIGETYNLLKQGMRKSDSDTRSIFEKWNAGKCSSFLLEITAKIFAFTDPGASGLLLNSISDQAKQKGTGKWTSQEAMDLGVPLPTVDMAITVRDASAYKSVREAMSDVYPKNASSDAFQEQLTESLLENAFYAAMLITYAQGMDMLHKAAKEHTYTYKLEEVARIWTGGCIIRAACLQDIRSAFLEKVPANLLLDPSIISKITLPVQDLRKVVAFAALAGIPAGAFMSALAYLDVFSSKQLPTNLTQAQRDFFGSHTYERLDKAGTFHTVWSEPTHAA